MRGEDGRSGRLFSYVDLEARVPAQHPLRAIRGIVNEALAGLSPEFEALYSHTGRPGIAPERLLRALLLQAFYSIRSERRLMQELEYNLLYRWFVGLGIDDAVWDATVFCKNRDRLLAGAVASRFLAALLALPRLKQLLSDEHFSVDGTLIEAWASIKSFRPGPGDDEGGAAAEGGGRNGERDFHGETWSNQTHRSTTDGDARLYRKGRNQEARLCYLGHALMENRHGLVVDGLVSRATGDAERLAAEAMLLRRRNRHRRITLGADKAYDAADFVATCASVRVTPHVARNTSGRRSNIPDAVAESPGYGASQKLRKRIEEVFAWVKTIAGQDKTRHRGLARVGWQFTLALAAYNLIRMPKLLAAPA
jgi:transposase